MTDEKAFLQTIADYPADDAPRLVFADWLTEHGRDHEAAWWREPDPSMARVQRSLRWLASGYGYASASGYGYGYGYGYGSKTLNFLDTLTNRVEIMELGKAYLIMLQDAIAFVGRPVEQTGPNEWRWESASNVHNTNRENNWAKLAEGNMVERRHATYKHWKMCPLIGPGALVKCEWAGKTTQEEGLPG